MSKHRIPNEKWMEFVSEIATQLTELNFHEDTFEVIGEKGIHLRFKQKMHKISSMKDMMK